MDEKNIKAGLIVVFVTSAFCFGCTQTKTKETVFPTANKKDEKVECEKSRIEGRYIVQWMDGHSSIEVANSDDQLIKKIIEPQLERIKFVEPDRRVVMSQDLSLISSSISKPTNEEMDQEYWGQIMIKAPEVWAQNILGDGVTVAVIDSGVSLVHDQLKDQLAINLSEIPGNGIDDEGNGLIDDVAGWNFSTNSPSVRDAFGHGTHVSGVILADPNAGPMKGVAPRAKLLPLSFMSESGQGGTLGHAILAMEYAAQQKVKIVNASWGGADCSKTLKDSIQMLNDKNILFVTASGNDGVDIDEHPEYPAAFNMSNQINVGASSIYDITMGFSNFGVHLVHLVAPGYQIISTFPPNTFKYMDGTSMAAPFVSGAAALLWSHRPQATVGQIKSALLAGVDVAYHPVATHGRLNVQRSILELEKLIP